MILKSTPRIDLLADAADTFKAELRRAERVLSDAIIAELGLKIGDVFRDRHTGNRYRLESAHGHRLNGGKYSCSVIGTRIYKSGRRDASTHTILSLDTLELDTAPAEG